MPVLKIRTFHIHNSRFLTDLWKPEILALWLLHSSRTAAGWTERHLRLLEVCTLSSESKTPPSHACFPHHVTHLGLVCEMKLGLLWLQGPHCSPCTPCPSSFISGSTSNSAFCFTPLPWHVSLFWLKLTQEAIFFPEDLGNQVRWQFHP